MSGPPNPVGRLRALVRTYPSALVAYSGGSIRPCWQSWCVRLGATGCWRGGPERLLSEAQWAAARAWRSAAMFHWSSSTHTSRGSDYLANPTNRCFFCKTGLCAGSSPRRGPRARRRVRRHNATTSRANRPGFAAGPGGGVRSPWPNGPHQGGCAASRARAWTPGVGRPGGRRVSRARAYGIPITSNGSGRWSGRRRSPRAGVTGDLRVRHTAT